MADERPGSHARDIDTNDGIKAPALTPIFNRAQEQSSSATERTASDQGAAERAAPLGSRQVAKTGLTPREPAPSFGYDRTKAGQHVEAMRADDRAVKQAALQAKANFFARQKAMQKEKAPPSLGKSFGRDRDRSDD